MRPTVLTPSERKENLKKSKAAYYKKNKDKYINWNFDNSLKKKLNDSNVEELKKILFLVDQQIKKLNNNSI
tara:strand:- start:6984 stop:7196 length:213 start_codon:yes stop_codon:yes gene_type:complete